MKVKVKLFKGGKMPLSLPKGDWIDLFSAEDVCFSKPQVKEDAIIFENKMIKLGVAMELPAGFEALVVPRSSLFKNHKIILVNSVGVIDNSYNGNDDQWRFPALAFDSTNVEQGERIAQFKIQLSQKATVWQKIQWLFSKKIEFIEVETLNEESRGGFGSSGK